VITEGNYLLVEGPDWGPVRPLLDECWHVDPGEDVRLNRLIARHISSAVPRTKPTSARTDPTAATPRS
jgi:pantothenate kinase